MPENRSDDPLTRLLRAADPAAGDPGLDPQERALMRQRLLEEASPGNRREASWLLPAATALALLALALGLALRQPQAPLPETVVELPRAAHATSSAGRQIQFTTDNGTLVIWVLQPRSTS
ncbi:MAG: hypothetical protein ACE5EG_00195 [Thermoanaerobaculia bacterium]